MGRPCPDGTWQSISRDRLTIAVARHEPILVPEIVLERSQNNPPYRCPARRLAVPVAALQPAGA